MYEGEFKELNRGWMRTGPSLLATGSDSKAWTGFRHHLVSDHQRSLFDMWLEKCEGHVLPERGDFSHLEILPMIHSFFVLEYNAAKGAEFHRFCGTAYTDAFGYEFKHSDSGQAHLDELGYSADEQVRLIDLIYEKGCPCIEKYPFDNSDKPHLGCIELTLPVRRAGSDRLGEAVGVGSFYGAETIAS